MLVKPHAYYCVVFVKLHTDQCVVSVGYDTH